ncbi:MAG: Calx-beta domain-containing protein, partial [bacterium]|nr:Calx-beta domain-containing protein [bacterium]
MRLLKNRPRFTLPMKPTSYSILLLFIFLLVLAVQPAAAATTFTTVDSTGDVGRYTSIQLNGSGNPVIAYRAVTGGDLKLAVCANPTCSTAPTITTVNGTNDTGWWASLKLNASGNPVISFYNSTMGNLRTAVCSNPTCSASNTIRDIDSTGDVGRYTSVEIASSGNPLISYYDFTNGDLKIAFCSTVTCDSGYTIRTLESDGDVGRHTSLALNSAGSPVISYYDVTNGDLKILFCGDATCSTGNVIRTLDSTGNVGTDTVLKLNGSGIPYISYHDVDNGNLKLVVCGDATCSTGNVIRTIDAGGVGNADVGEYNALQLRGGEIPVIAYRDTTNSALKVAVCADATCSTGTSVRTVDNAPQVGEFTSMALNASGFPVISYYDNLNDDLELAVCDTQLCGASTATVEFTSQADITVAENAGVVTIPVELSVVGDTIPGPVTVSVGYAGTANSGTDYTGGLATVSYTNGAGFAAGTYGRNIQLTLTDDALAEGTETIILTLSAPSGATLGGKTTRTVNITDNDGTTVTVAANDAEAAEPNNPGQFTLTLSAPNNTGAPLNVTYTVAGTATAGTDYTTLTGTATIANGATTTTIDVTPIDDSTDEPNETVIVTLTGTDNAAVVLGTTVSATVTLADNDDPATNTVTIAANDAEAAEPDQPGQFTVTLSQANNTGSPLTINFTVTGTATSGTDYTALPASVSIPNGESSATLNVTPIDDTVDEPNETVIVTLTGTNNAGVTLGTTVEATVTIADNDEPTGLTVTIAANDADAAEPDQPGQFTVTLSQANNTGSPLTINFTVTGTATSGTDYTALPLSVSIPNGETSATINVTPIDDTVDEPNETVIVTLTASPSVTLGATVEATVTIADNDEPTGPTVTIAANDADAAEPDQPGQFTVTLSAANNTGSPLTINFTVAGTATSGTDYTALPASVSISNGETSATLNVTP